MLGDHILQKAVSSELHREKKIHQDTHQNDLRSTLKTDQE